jgi:transposase
VSKLPDDPEALKAIIMRLQGERDDLHTTNLRLQVELDRLKKRYYGPRADRLETMTDLAQMLLSFAEELDNKPVHPEDASGSPPEQSQQPQQPQQPTQQPQRHLQKSKGRRNLAKFENLPATTFVHELSAEQRACPCCGEQRKEIGAEQSWQIEYHPGHFERLEHIRKKYACVGCETEGDGPQMETAAKPEAPVEKGLAGPGLLAFIVTSKFADYVGFPVMLWSFGVDAWILGLANPKTT